jgi:FkbH-like protein
MYQADIMRKQEEDNYEGPQDSFLASLGLRLTIAPAQEEDLARAEELTVRTHQLNTTGYTYSYEELDAFRKSECHHLWIAGLEDRYGAYGKIGLVLIETSDKEWWIRLLLMSCRVMNRGVGSVLINYIRNEAREAGVRLLAEMLPNNRNRIMYMTYKFNHFMERETSENRIVFENNLDPVIDYPRYVKLELG